MLPLDMNLAQHAAQSKPESEQEAEAKDPEPSRKVLSSSPGSTRYELHALGLKHSVPHFYFFFFPFLLFPLLTVQGIRGIAIAYAALCSSSVFS